MSSYRSSAIACLAAFAVASCASLVRDEVAAPEQGGSVALRTGTPLVVSLPADPDAGYGWVLRSSTPNLALIGGPDYTPTPRPPGLVGVANTTVYRFRALDPGSGALEFVWTPPPGQPPPVPERVVRYDVQINKSIALPTDFFGTVGMNSVRGGDYAPPTDAAPVKVNTTPVPPEAPAGGSTPASVKYWSF